jgi:hypothetical protein
MRIAWLVPFLLLGLSACVNEAPPATPTTVVQPAPAVVAPAAPGTTVITHP